MSQTLKDNNQKIFSIDDLTKALEKWRKNGNTIVFTNGCFDILHRGHLTYLAQAKDFGDRLILGLNSDASVKALEKGTNRPINNEQDRAFFLASLSFIDGVIIFNDQTPIRLIEQIKPDVLIKGGDYDPEISDSDHKKYIVGSDIVKKNGGQVKTIPFVKGYSTTKIIEKIKSD